MNKKELHNKNKDSASKKVAQEINGVIPSMKPLGKYLGMDAFSWHNPDLELLEKTVSSFPFDMLWVGNENEIKGFLDKNYAVETKINRCIVYGLCSDNCSNKIISIPSIREAINHLNNLTFKPGILLFTASDSDSEFSMRFFEEYIFNSHLNQ